MIGKIKKLSTLSLIFSVLATSAMADNSTDSPWDVLTRLQNASEKLSALPSIRTQSLIVVQKAADFGIETTKFQHYYKDLEVIGSMGFHHYSISENKIQLSDLLAHFDLDTKPSLSMQEAINLGHSFISTYENEIASLVMLKDQPTLKILPSKDENSARLVYWLSFSAQDNETGLDLLMDAHTGELIAEIPHQITVTLPDIEVYSAANAPNQSINPLNGAPLWIDIKQLDHVVTKGRASEKADLSAQHAMNNAQKTVNYYFNRHKRSSFDNRSTALVSVVHVGRRFANAFWNSQQKLIGYGDGDGNKTGDFSVALDVAGHELTHGVISETAGLLYFGESGALNEAYADFFGKMIENSDDWVLGRAIFLKQEDIQKGIRNIANPHALTVSYIDKKGNKTIQPYPAHMQEKLVATGACSGRNDNCWVHINSTIASHAAYQIILAIGKEKTERLFYLTLSQYLTPLSGFRAYRNATVKACHMIYDSKTCESVLTAFAKTGL